MTGKRVQPIWSAAAGSQAAVFSSRPATLRGPRRHIKTSLTHQEVHGGHLRCHLRTFSSDGARGSAEPLWPLKVLLCFSWKSTVSH